MYYLQTLKNYNKARDTVKRYINEDELIKLDHISCIIYNYRKELFPEFSHEVWLKEENFDCVLASICLAPSIPKDSSIPTMAYELSENIGEDNYDSLVKMINHPYSIPLSVIVYVTINTFLENEEITGYPKDFYQISRDYLGRNLQIDPFCIIPYYNSLWKPERKDFL